MTMPIIIYRPKVVIQPLDEAGAPAGSPVDVSCDLSSVELTVDQPIATVTTFCGKFQVPDEIEEGATLEVTVNADTDSNWSPLVGVQGEFRVWDREDSTTYRKFNAHIGVNPSLYGTNTPGEARTVSFDVPVTSDVEWATGAYSAS